MKRNKLIVGIGLLLIGVFALYGFAKAEMNLVAEWDSDQFTSPHDVAVDSDDFVYVTDLNVPFQEHDDRIMKFTSAGGLTEEIWAIFDYPAGVTVDEDYIYVTDSFNTQAHIYRINRTNGSVETPDTNIPGAPWDIAVDSGIVYVANPGTNCIQRITFVDGDIAIEDLWENDLVDPSDIAFGLDGSVYVADGDSGTVKKLDGVTGNWETWQIPNGDDPPNASGIMVDSEGNVHVVDYTNNRIVKFSSDGIADETWDSVNETVGFTNPRGITIDSQGYIYVADKGNHRILKFTPNVAPTVYGITTVPVDPVVPFDVDDHLITVEASFSDPNIDDTHTATWTWGDGNTSVGTVDPNNDSVTGGPYTYDAPGVYTLTLTVTDNHGAEGIATFQYVVVYNPNGGFVTGGGWIDSPAGAYVPDSELEGKANFGFVSKYKNGATIPTGETEFNFKVADMNFHSSSYDWLVVAGSKAQYKGIGTINGEGEYKFMLKAFDADINENDAFEFDGFRIKIWSEDEFGVEDVVYDNGLGVDFQDEDENPLAGMTAIGGGSIVIHE